MKGVISELPAEDRAKVEACAAEIRAAIDKAGDAGVIALALVGLEKQGEE